MLVVPEVANKLNTSKKKIEETVMDNAKYLMDQQKSEADKVELIKAHIEITNLKLQLAVEMKYEEFESMIDKDLSDIKERKQN